MEIETDYPAKPAEGPLNTLWDLPVKNLVQLKARPLTAAEKERHTLYSLLVLALMDTFWNGNKKGRLGDYPWRSNQKHPNGHGYIGGDYLGHNIACIGVDGRGRVIDFDFNHNDIFDSTVEHAESRLVRRIFSLAHLHDGWLVTDPTTPLPKNGSSSWLTDVTVYTSLEPCSQCAGMMTLGHVKDFIFLQPDPGQFSIGNILRNLGEKSSTKYLPPWPIPASQFEFDYFNRQQEGYAKFSAEVKQRPFFISADGTAKDTGASIASYLCTDAVHDLVKSEAQRLRDMTEIQFPDFRPSTNGIEIPGTLRNAEVLEHLKKFLSYAAALGKRGTPHQM